MLGLRKIIVLLPMQLFWSLAVDMTVAWKTIACVCCSQKVRLYCRYPEGDLDTNLTIVITNVGADFTRLGSFGDAEQFGGQLVAQMDRSYLNRSWNKPKQPPQVTAQDFDFPFLCPHCADACSAQVQSPVND